MAAEASASSQIIEAGHSVGSYTLTHEIGKGSFAVVYQGRATSRRRRSSDRSDQHSEGDQDGGRRPSASAGPSRVAVKIVTRKKLTTKLLENLEGEISILRTVRHANIVELIDCLKTSSHIYLIMQYCRMGDLSNFIKTRPRSISPNAEQYRQSVKGSSGDSARPRPGTSDAQDAYVEEMDARYPHPWDGGLNHAFIRSFLAQLSGALQFMRARNIVHRDIKPQNLLLQEPEPALVAAGHPEFIPQVKVADFGFARHLEAASLAETLCGSPLYMAPEILRYEKYDAKADLWSVGAVLFEMCIGKPPFRASNHVELLRKIERGEDRIKFPDERSDDSLRREHFKRIEEGRGQTSAEFVRPHTVADDLKALIRSLLKKRPVERLGFEDLFNSEVLLAYKHTMQRAIAPEVVQGSERVTAEDQEASSSVFQPIATRTAPAVPGSVASSTRGAPRDNSVSASGADAVQSDDKTTARSKSLGQNEGQIAPKTPRAYFAPRYVVRGIPSSSVPVKPKPAGSNNQQKLRTDSERPSSANEQADGEASSLEDNVLETPGSSVTRLHSGAASERSPPLATPALAGTMQDTGSKPGSVCDEERGYVMVDRKGIDANALIEEGAAKFKQPGERTGWSPLGVVRRPSQLGRLASLGGFSAASTVGVAAAVAALSSSPQEPSPLRTTSHPASLPTPSSAATRPVSMAHGKTSPPTTATPSSLKLGSTPPNAPFALPRSARRPSFQHRKSQASEGSRLTPPPTLRQQTAPTLEASKALRQSGDSASDQVMSQAIPQQAPSSALARAISMASVRLFGVPTTMSMRGASVRRSLRMGLLSSSPTHAAETIGAAGGANSGQLSVSEQNLLGLLQDYGQKSFVLSEFADAKLSQYFTDGPHQNNHAAAERWRRASAGSVSSATRASPASNTTPSYGAGASATGSSPPMASSHASQVASSEALVLYVRSLSFLQRAIDAVRDYIDVYAGSSSRYAKGPSASSSSSASFHSAPEIVDTVQWLHAKFNDGYERANFARSKAAEELPETAQHVDKMIFDKALEIARAAALDELENGGGLASTISISGTPGSTSGSSAITASTSQQRQRHAAQGWNAEHCLLAYETANSMLMALLDPAEDCMDLSTTAIGTIEKFTRSITKRITGLQRHYEALNPPLEMVPPLSTPQPVAPNAASAGSKSPL